MRARVRVCSARAVRARACALYNARARACAGAYYALCARWRAATLYVAPPVSRATTFATRCSEGLCSRSCSWVARPVPQQSARRARVGLATVRGPLSLALLLLARAEHRACSELPPPHCTLRRWYLHRKVRRPKASAVRVPPERRDLCDQRPQRPILRRGKSLYDSRASRPSRSHAPAHRSAQVHGMYHNFYQDHLAEPQAEMGPGRGPDWGHWISRDFLHWARLPVAIWNDQWYRQRDLLLLRWYAAIH